ncbi:hypothetical protein [[Mycobacterium] vasticus]|uniref:PE-PGRS family protein n=1 Tax=[Mycobacterium] vasticus TaxID=2875777 RepID=A0ABU5YTE1_9MYCO|nr:hypothetical protein [Mycolicibacter sp. MYC017]MEB3067709.1 hypothetical protein [Mycolicibacter sp. MYC017]
MQLALAARTTDQKKIGTASTLVPTTRANLVLAAGIALAGAGVIAVNPVAPMLSMDIQHSAVQLTSTTEDNLAGVMDLLSAPNPIFTALGELSSYYSNVAQDSFTQSLAGVEGIWSGLGGSKGLETIIPLMMDYIKAGDTSNAYNLLNNDMLFNIQNIFQPLFNHTPRGGTEEIPGILSMNAELTQVWANVQDVFSDFSFWKGASRYFIEPLAGFQFALADQFNTSADHVAQDPFDALLNGYVPWDVPDGSTSEQPHAAFIGLISPTGSFNYFFDVFPNLIADALTKDLPVVDTDIDTSAMADANLFDLSWLDGIFA